MRIRVLGGGWYGCHIASHLMVAGHQVELHEIRDKLFGGASGANPARLHLGFHYPRSHQTRALSQSNYREFMDVYGNLTRGVGVNIYAIADRDSLVDFDNYIQTLLQPKPYFGTYRRFTNTCPTLDLKIQSVSVCMNPVLVIIATRSSSGSCSAISSIYLITRSDSSSL